MVRWAEAEEVSKAWERISEEFMNRYWEFLGDVKNGQTKEFGRKYGILLTEAGIEAHSKDTAQNVAWFQQNIFSGRWLPEWEAVGYSRNVIWQLSLDGFLSDKEYSNWTARHTGKTSWFYISQKRAREIYKKAKGK